MKSNLPPEKISLYLGDLAAPLAAAAAANSRTLPQEIRHRLKESIDRENKDIAGNPSDVGG